MARALFLWAKITFNVSYLHIIRSPHFLCPHFQVTLILTENPHGLFDTFIERHVSIAFVWILRVIVDACIILTVFIKFVNAIGAGPG